MSNYRKILVGIDLSKQSEQVVDRAKALAQAFEAELNLIHVIEPLSFAYGGDLPLDFTGLQDEIQRQAKDQLLKMGERCGVSEAHQHLVVGRPEHEIHATADDLGADLVVVGSHGRHGLGLLLGSTSSGVLHGTHCDVLAVRVKD